MNNLDRAKELREAKEILILRAQKIMKDNFSNGWDCDESFFKHKSYAKTIEDINKTAKQLKEKVEKGCDKFYNQRNVKIPVQDWCGVTKYYERNIFIKDSLPLKLCPDCQETLKILNEILGEKE